MKFVETPRMRGQNIHERKIKQAMDEFQKTELDYLFNQVKAFDIHTHNLNFKEIVANIPRVLKTLRKDVKLRLILGDAELVSELRQKLSYVDGLYVPCTDPRLKDRVMILYTVQPIGQRGSILSDCIPYPEIIFKRIAGDKDGCS